MKKIFFPLILIMYIFISISCVDDDYSPGDHSNSPYYKTFIAGAPINGSNGIYFDLNDKLYVASVFGRDISKVDPSSGKIVKRFGPESGVDTPDDVVFGPDGSMYWTSLSTGYVGRMYPDGSVKTQYVNMGVNPITISEDGARLFVACDFYGDGFYELDPALEQAPRLIKSEMGWLNGFDLGPDGFLYGPIVTSSIVAKVDVETGDCTPIPVELQGPCAVKFDDEGYLYTCESAIGQVVKINTETWTKEVLATGLPPGQDNLAFDSKGNLYVSHFGNGSIIEIKKNDNMRTVIKEENLSIFGGFEIIENSDGTETIYAANHWSLAIYDMKGNPQTYIASWWYADPTIMTTPTSVSECGNYVLLSSSSDLVPRVQIYDPVNLIVIQDCSYDPASGDLPVDAVDFGSNVAVAVYNRYSNSGYVVLADKNNLYSQTTVVSNLTGPAGILAINNDLYVSDCFAGKVLKVIEKGAVLTNPVEIATGLQGPEGMAVDKEGKILVVESGSGKLLCINLDDKSVTAVVEGMEPNLATVPGFAPSWMLNDVEVSKDGRIFVGNDRTNTIYEIK